MPVYNKEKGEYEFPSDQDGNKRRIENKEKEGTKVLVRESSNFLQRMALSFHLSNWTVVTIYFRSFLCVYPIIGVIKLRVRTTT